MSNKKSLGILAIVLLPIIGLITIALSLAIPFVMSGKNMHKANKQIWGQPFLKWLYLLVIGFESFLLRCVTAIVLLPIHLGRAAGSLFMLFYKNKQSVRAVFLQPIKASIGRQLKPWKFEMLYFKRLLYRSVLRIEKTMRQFNHQKIDENIKDMMERGVNDRLTKNISKLLLAIRFKKKKRVIKQLSRQAMIGYSETKAGEIILTLWNYDRSNYGRIKISPVREYQERQLEVKFSCEINKGYSAEESVSLHNRGFRHCVNQVYAGTFSMDSDMLARNIESKAKLFCLGGTLKSVDGLGRGGNAEGEKRNKLIAKAVEKVRDDVARSLLYAKLRQHTPMSLRAQKCIADYCFSDKASAASCPSPHGQAKNRK